MASVVVVGAGMGGMAVAARLSAQGHDVAVLEQADRAGGAVQTYRRDGFAFDTGPALLTLPAVYRDLFLKTPVGRRGAALEDNVDLQGLATAFGCRWSDGATAVLPGSNSRRVASALGHALGGGAEAEWQRFSRRAADLWAVTRVPYFETPVSGGRNLAPMLRRWSNLRTIAPWRSLRGLARQHFTDPRLVTLVDRHANAIGADPRRAPAALAVFSFVEQTFGAWHVGGGVGRLAEALHERCVARGITFRFGADVVAVRTASAGVQGVALASGESVDADLVVADVDATHLYAHLVDDPAVSAPLRRVRRVSASASSFDLLLALRGRTPGLQHHNLLFPADPDAELDALFAHHPRPADDPTVQICAPDDPAMRPDADHEAWRVRVSAPRHDPERGVDWSDQALVASYRERILGLLATRGLDVRDRLLWCETRTPVDRERDTRAPGGAVAGAAARTGLRQAANRSPVPGLFLVGGTAHPGAGLPLVGMSAAIVADLIGLA